MSLIHAPSCHSPCSQALGPRPFSPYFQLSGRKLTGWGEPRLILRRACAYLRLPYTKKVAASNLNGGRDKK